jgi:ATP-grasp ribosomal peptide maturase
MSHAVLILSDEADVGAPRVAAELAVRGVPVVRVDAAEFPARLSLAAEIDTRRTWSGTLKGAECDLELGQVGAVYRRRPTQFEMDPRMSAPERAFAYGEARRGFGGVLTALTDCLWVNDPVAAARCEYKPVQLAAARRCGLRIPATLITSAPEAAHRWAKHLDRPVIYKPLNGVWHADEGRIRALYTTPIDDHDELLDPALSRTAHLFQEQVDKQFEARVVVVGDQVFAVRIDARTREARTDWRSDYDALDHSAIDIPDQLRTALIALHARLGLVYGAVDLIYDTDDQWIFLETNQSGEWVWLTVETGAPIAGALADVLEKGPQWSR